MDSLEGGARIEKTRMLSGWPAVAATLACVVPGWCALAGFRLGQRRPLPDRAFADGMASLALSMLWLASCSAVGASGPVEWAAPEAIHSPTLAMSAFIAVPGILGAGLGRLTSRSRTCVVLLLSDGTILHGEADKRSLGDDVTTVRMRRARIAEPGCEPRVVMGVEVARSEVRMLWRDRPINGVIRMRS